MGKRFTAAERDQVWEWFEAGVPPQTIAKRMGREKSAVRSFIQRAGGRRPPARANSGRRLCLAEREEISRGLAAGLSFRAIAAGLGRSPSTVSREVNASGGRRHYRALAADRAAIRRARRPKRAKLARCRRLRRAVEAKLAKRWSPEQISAWLARAYPEDPEMRVSHETIYQSLFVQSRGALRAELHTCLRSGRAMRRPAARAKGGYGQGQLRNMIMISERPAEASDRAVPGHWEGDLIFGKKMTSVATLVERHSRYLMLVRLANGHSADAVRKAIARRIMTLPDQLRRSLTWDQGKEMAHHVEFTIDTGVQVYFCDPKSPWQRGSNENTNRLVRQYLPRTTDLSKPTQCQLDAIARELNERPRQTLGWKTPSEVFADAVASTP